MSHHTVAASVRREKEQHPELYCRNPRCLWRVSTREGLRPCPKHPVASAWAVQHGYEGETITRNEE